jgi:hypothetical protein
MLLHSVQIYSFLMSFYVFSLPVTERKMLKYPTVIMDLLLSSVLETFASCILRFYYLVHIYLGCLYLSNELTLLFLWYVAYDPCYFDMNIGTVDFFKWFCLIYRWLIFFPSYSIQPVPISFKLILVDNI